MTWTLDDLESHIVPFVTSTFIHITSVHMAAWSLIVNGRTDEHTRKCKLLGHVARRRRKNSKILLEKNKLLSHSIVCDNRIQPSYKMAKEIDFETGNSRKF